MAVVKSVEYKEVSITAATEGTAVNLSKGQAHAQCTPFWSVRNTGTITDQHQDRLGEVEIIDNSGTAAVRVSASARADTDASIFQIFIVEWDTSITIEKRTVTGLTDGTASFNQTINNVTTQSTAFMIYSYQYTSPQSSDDDWNDAAVQVRYNGGSTTSVTLSRRASVGDCNGTLYVIKCSSTEFIVDHREIDVTSSSATSGTDTIGTTVETKTFLVHSYETSEGADDMRDGAWQADLQNSTTVRVRRGDASPSGQNATSTHSIAVVECQGTEWDVQREAAVALTSASVTDSITTIDEARSIINCLDHASHPFSVGRNDSIDGNQIDDIQSAADFSASNLVRYRMRVATITTSIVSYEVIQFVLPVDFTALSDATWVPANYYVGPFFIGGASYTFALTADLLKIVAMKASSDPLLDNNWSNQDDSVTITGTDTIQSLWCIEDGQDIHIATQQLNGRVAYHLFDPGTDTWTTKDETVVTNNPVSASEGCSIALRSDGDIIILYTGADASDDAVYYARKEGSWTTDVRVDGGSANDFQGAAVVRGASDRMHFFYKEHAIFSVSRVYHRSLSSGNSLDTQAQIDSTAFIGQAHLFVRGISYVSGATKVFCCYRDTSTTTFTRLDSGADPTLISDASLSNSDSRIQNGTAVACMATNGTTAYVVWSDRLTFETWISRRVESEAFWRTALNINDVQTGHTTTDRLSCAIFDRGDGDVMGIVYSDGGTMKYSEVPVGLDKLSVTEFPTQNYYCGPFQL